MDPVYLTNLLHVLRTDDVEKFKGLIAQGLPLNFVQEHTNGRKPNSLFSMALQQQGYQIAQHMIDSDVDHVMGNGVFKSVFISPKFVPTLVSHGFDAKSAEAQDLFGRILGISSSGLSYKRIEEQVKAVEALVDGGTPTDKFTNRAHDMGFVIFHAQQPSDLDRFLVRPDVAVFLSALDKANLALEEMSFAGRPLAHFVTSAMLHQLEQSRILYVERGIIESGIPEEFNGSPDQVDTVFDFSRALSAWRDRGVDMNALDALGETPLTRAISDDHSSEDNILCVVKALLSAGADPSVRNLEGDTGAELAKYRQFHRAVEQLSLPKPTLARGMRP